MTLWMADEYDDEEILQGFQEDLEAQADEFLLETEPELYGNDHAAAMDDADAWLAAQDVPDWTTWGGDW